MTSAVLQIVGGLGIFAFLTLMLARGPWVRQGANRALAAALMLAALATALWGSSLEQFGSRARLLSGIAASGYLVALAAVLFWAWKRTRARS